MPRPSSLRAGVALAGLLLFSLPAGARAQSLTAAPFVSVATSAVTASWTSTFPGGTLYYTQASTSPVFAGTLVSSNTLDVQAAFAGLSANTTYYARVSTAPSGPYTALGSTVTLVQTPTALYFDEVSTGSLVVAAYAPTPAFTNLNLGLSGTNIAKDGVYAGWHGEKWTSKAAMPTARYALGGAASGGRIFVFGGWTFTASGVHEEYDPFSDTWRTKTSLTTVVDAVRGVALDGYVYAVSGENTGGVVTALQRFDPAANAWTARAALPAAAADAGVGVLGGRLYAAGGYDGATTGAVRRFDPALNAWASRTAMPAPTQSPAAAVWNGRLYAAGGWNSSYLSQMLAYDPAADSWTALSPMPGARADAQAVQVGGKIYVIGGSSGSVVSRNEEYDPAVDAWTARAAMPTARGRLAAAVVGGRVYAIGGANGSGVTANEEYDPGVAQYFSGLTPNTLYAFKAKARNILGVETAETLSVSTYTAAAVPAAGAPTFLGATATSLQAQWTANGNPAGTEYRVSGSTAADFNAAASSAVGSWGTALSATLSGLTPNTTWYVRAQARNAVGVETLYALLGATVTLVQTPTALYFDEVSSNSLVVSAYAPTPAFTNLNLGLSGTNIAKDGVYAGWHGESWTARSPMTVARQQFGLCPADGYLYAVGGHTGSAYTAAVERYDAAADTWTTRASMPSARSDLSCASLRGRVYALGGSNGGPSLSTNAAYDPAANAWTTLAPMASPRAFFGAASVGGRVHAVGGWSGAAYLSSLESYDPDANAWAARAALALPRISHFAGSHGDSLYVLAGATGSWAMSAATDRYDPAANTWSSRAAMPIALAEAGAAVPLGGKLHVFGGATGPGAYSSRHFEYDPGADAWTERAPLSAARWHQSAAVLGGKAYVAGGAAGGPVFVLTEAYDPGVAQLFTGLSPNTLYSFKAKARNILGVETAETLSLATYTAAALPGTPLYFWVGTSSAELRWSAGGNPAGTEFSAELSAASSFVPLSSTAWTADLLSAVFTGLAEGTTQYARVRARNAAGVPTEYAAAASTATRYATVAGCAATFDVSRTGAGFPSLTGALAAVPAVLTGETCVVVRDSSVYSEAVTVSGKSAGAFRLRIEPAAGAAPVLTPPAGATAGLRLLNSGVDVSGLVVRTTNTASYGILVSSAGVTLSSVSVDSGGKITVAGIQLGTGTALSYSSVTTQAADGVRVVGSSNTVAFTTASAGGNGFYFLGATSNTLRDSFGYAGYGAFLYHSRGTLLARNVLRRASGSPGGAGLYLNDSSSNVVTACMISNTNGTGLDMTWLSDGNLIELSTIAAAGLVYTALEVTSARGTRVSRVYVHSDNGNASTFSSGTSESVVEHSTFSTLYGGAAALSTNGSSDTFRDNLLLAPNGSALALNGSSTTVSLTTGVTASGSYATLYSGSGGLVTIRDSYFANSAGDGGKVENTSWLDISRSTLTGAGGGAALRFSGSSSNTVTASRLWSPGGPGLSVGSFYQPFDQTTTTGSGNAFSGLVIRGSPAVRFSPAPGVALSSSVLEADPGGVGLVMTSLPLVSTFTALAFTGGDYGVDALSLPAGSRVTLRDASGAAAGSLRELDPRAQVDWLPDPAPGSAGTPCADVFVARAAGGGDCTALQACVDLIPSSPLTGDACVLVADSASYSGQVAIRGKQPAGHRIRLEGAFPSARPTLQGDSTENGLLLVANDSVTVRDVILRSPTNEGLVVSSADARVERVFVDQWTNGKPGIQLSSWTTLSDSSVSVTAAFGAPGIRVTGIGASVSRSTVTGKGGIDFLMASSASVTDSYAANDYCYGLTVDRSDYNSVSRSTVIGTNDGCAGLKVFSGSHNDFDRLSVLGVNTAGVSFDNFPGPEAGNSVRRSTITGGSASWPAVHLEQADAASFQDTWIHAVANDAFYAHASQFSVRRTTLTADAPGAAAVHLDNSPIVDYPNSIEDSYLHASTGAILSAYFDVSLARSTIAASGTGLYASNIGHVSFSSLTILTQGGTGVWLDSSDFVELASSTVSGASLGLGVSGPSYLMTLAATGLTFSSLAPGATALRFAGGDFASTFTAVSVDASAATSVDAVGLSPGSRVTMRDAAGARGGSLYEDDPLAQVDWVPDAAPFVLPSSPTAPSATVLGTSSIAWTWSASAGAESYRLYASSDASVWAAPAATGVVLTGLAPSTTYSVMVAPFAHYLTGALSAAATAHTLAAPPSGLSLAGLFASSAALTWSANGNPAGTLAELQRSTDAAAYAVRAGTLATTAYDAELVGCTSYWYRVRNRNPAGVDTAFDGPLLVRTAASTPAAPGSLTATSLPGRRVQLDWSASLTEGIVAYLLYKDSGAGVVDYSAPYAQFSGTTFSTATVALSSAAPHLFGLRAVHRCGVTETNTHAVASAWALESLDGVRAAVKTPETGKKISGNRVLVMAEMATGDPRDVASVRFQYRSSGAGSWLDVPAANANHPNPDLEQPFFVHWDVTALADGAYDLRAVATGVDGSSDPAPGAITLRVDSVNFEVKETDLGGGKVKKEQFVSNQTTNTVTAAESGSGVVSKVQLPAGALASADATLSVTPNPTALPAPPAGGTSIGAALEVSLSNGQSLLSGGQTAAIVFNYPDDDGDGVIDGTQVRAEDARIQTFDTASNQWKSEFATTLDKDKRTLTGRTPHFSMFAAFGVKAANLDGIRVYPNPYKPNGGNADEGRPYSRADPLSGVVFDNLPAAVRIVIYTLTGREVCSFGTDAGTGALQWDGKNDGGEDVASGGYFAVITSPGQSPVVKKLAVVR